eukprot:1290577-Amphidinium_carterae.1
MEVEFVSLGNYCMLSLALKALGLRTCSYPLDYTRSSARGLIHLFTTGFVDFMTGTAVQGMCCREPQKKSAAKP